MSTINNLWKEFVVPLGLMNGARGRIVAVLYKPEGQARTDGLQAPTGYPNGLDGIALLPDMVVVHFPGYKAMRFSLISHQLGFLFVACSSATNTKTGTSLAFRCGCAGQSRATNVKASQKKMAA